MSTEQNDWRSELLKHAINVEAITTTLDRASNQSGIPTEEIGLAEIALQHSADMYAAGKLSLALAYGGRATDIAEGLRKELALIPEVMRDRARQKGPRKKNDALQNSINKLVNRLPGLTARELWEQASSVITDQIEFDRFRKRVTEARRLGRQ
jgi:hypothetical protein